MIFGCDLSIAINEIKQRCSSQIEKPRNRSIPRFPIEDLRPVDFLGGHHPLECLFVGIDRYSNQLESFTLILRIDLFE